MNGWVIEFHKTYVALLMPLGHYWIGDINTAFRVARREDAEAYWKCFGDPGLAEVKFVELKATT